MQLDYFNMQCDSCGRWFDWDECEKDYDSFLYPSPFGNTNHVKVVYICTFCKHGNIEVRNDKNEL
jgi:hypothetical protein